MKRINLLRLIFFNRSHLIVRNNIPIGIFCIHSPARNIFETNGWLAKVGRRIGWRESERSTIGSGNAGCIRQTDTPVHSNRGETSPTIWQMDWVAGVASVPKRYYAAGRVVGMSIYPGRVIKLSAMLASWISLLRADSHFWLQKAKDSQNRQR